MSRYAACFNNLEQQKRIAWIPFMMLGYPDPESCIKLIKVLIDEGADALELGIPFSDPIADGKMVQIAAKKALTQGVHVNDCFEMIAEIRRYAPSIPIGLLTYSNLVFRPGIDNFYQHCADAGVDSVLIADVPAMEAERFKTSASRHGIDTVLIAPPNADNRTIESIAKLTEGYTYVVSRPGVTGDQTEAHYPKEVLEMLQNHNSAPAVLGFGISTPEQVFEAARVGFRGAIAGSAVVRVIEQNGDEPEKALADYGRAMREATGIC